MIRRSSVERRDASNADNQRPCITGRAIRNDFMERWEERENDLISALDEEIPGFRAVARDGDFDRAMIWAGEGVDVISDVAPAGELVRRIGAETEACLRQARELLRKA